MRLQNLENPANLVTRKNPECRERLARSVRLMSERERLYCRR